MPFHLRILGSSSEGNCAILQSDGAALMIDCGFGAEEIEGELSSLGLESRALCGLILTHVHGDHARPAALRRIARSGVPLCAPRPVIHELRSRRIVERSTPSHTLPPYAPFSLAAFAITAIPVPHDSPGGCFAYRVSGVRAGRTLGYATDIGYPTRGLEECLIDSDLIVLESNHDPLMLEQSDRPRALKTRIRGMGHLSNHQSADLLSGVLCRSQRQPEAVVLAHLSQECNTPEIAVRTAGAALRQHARRDIRLLASPPFAPGITVTL